jgi:hypothetical protein
MDTFWFCDTHFPPGLTMPPVLGDNKNYRLVSHSPSGNTDSQMENRVTPDGRSYRFLEPSKLSEIYRAFDNRHVTILRRRGFGQIALQMEFVDRTIGVFMHRGDSMGEGGSNTWFLAMRKRTFEPCSELFSKLAKKLADRALIISDGSNTRLKQLSQFHSTETSSQDAYEHLRKECFVWGGFRWQCVGWMSERYGPTLVWGLERI